MPAAFPRLLILIGLACVMMGAVALVAAQGAAPVGTPYDWNLPPGFPPPLVPESNPMSAEKVELGRHLFYDRRLSGNETTACSSCHLQALAFSDGRTVGVGSTGDLTPRNSMALVNVVYNATFTWSHPNLVELERQILIPLFGEFPVEMGITGSEDAVLARLREDERYLTLFPAAFPAEPDPFTYGNVVDSLAAFVRSLISGNAAYDRYIYQRDPDALSESAQRGMSMFFSEALECFHCHSGFNMTISLVHANTTFFDRPFFNTGLYNVDGSGAYPAPNVGIFEFTRNPQDMGKFRPPTLRNIELTAPYMHDGSLATLEEVLAFYERGGRLIEAGAEAGDGRENPYKSGFVPGFELTPQERTDLINFLKSLTDTTFVTDPRHADPFAASDS
jgi:cytochrome c peroxidase